MQAFGYKVSHDIEDELENSEVNLVNDDLPESPINALDLIHLVSTEIFESLIEHGALLQKNVMS